MGTIHKAYSDLTSFMCGMCIYEILSYVASRNHNHNQGN